MAPAAREHRRYDDDDGGGYVGVDDRFPVPRGAGGDPGAGYRPHDPYPDVPHDDRYAIRAGDRHSRDRYDHGAGLRGGDPHDDGPHDGYASRGGYGGRDEYDRFDGDGDSYREPGRREERGQADARRWDQYDQRDTPRRADRYDPDDHATAEHEIRRPGDGRPDAAGQRVPRGPEPYGTGSVEEDWYGRQPRTGPDGTGRYDHQLRDGAPAPGGDHRPRNAWVGEASPGLGRGGPYEPAGSYGAGGASARGARGAYGGGARGGGQFGGGASGGTGVGYADRSRYDRGPATTGGGAYVPRPASVRAPREEQPPPSRDSLLPYVAAIVLVAVLAGAVGYGLNHLVGPARGTRSAPSPAAPTASAQATAPAAVPDPGTTAAAGGALSGLTAEKVAIKLSEAGLPLRTTVIYTAATDPDQLLGRTGGYTSRVAFSDPRVGANEVAGAPRGAIERGGAVEVFATPAAAGRRATHLLTVTDQNPLVTEHVYVQGTVVLRVSLVLTDGQAQAYETTLRRLFD